MTLPHISIYQLHYEGDHIYLVEIERRRASEDGLLLLLNSPGVLIGQNEDISQGLIPCFDLRELQRRNQAKRRK